MSLQLSIRIALLSVIAICGCSTGTPNISSMSFNPFSGLSATWKGEKKPTSQFAFSTSSEPKKPPTLDWFRRGGTKASSGVQPSLNAQAMFAQQALAGSQASPPAFAQMQQPAQQGFAPAYQPATTQQYTAAQGPFVNSGSFAATAPPTYQTGAYGAAQGYAPPTNMTAQPYGQMPQSPPAQYTPQTQNAAVATYGAPAQNTPQYPSVPGYNAAPAQYSTASQQNAPQYSQPTGFQGSSLR